MNSGGADETLNQQGWGFKQYFDFAAKSAGLLTLLLPAIGILIRFTAFSLSDIQPADTIALAKPLPNLAMTGFSALLGPVLLIAFLFYAANKSEPVAHGIHLQRTLAESLLSTLDRRFESSTRPVALKLMSIRLSAFASGFVSASYVKDLLALEEELRVSGDEPDPIAFQLRTAFQKTVTEEKALPPFLRLPRWLVPLFIAIGVGIGLFTSWPYALSGLIAGNIGGWLVRRILRRGESVTFGTAWPAILVTFAISGLAVSVSPAGYRAGYYTFGEESGLETGWYTELGATASGFYLRPCGHGNRPPVVFSSFTSNSSAVYDESDSVPPVPSIWNLMNGSDFHVGIRHACPTDLRPPSELLANVGA